MPRPFIVVFLYSCLIVFFAASKKNIPDVTQNLYDSELDTIEGSVAYQCGQAPLLGAQESALRIVGGEPVSERGLYPFVVNIKMGWTHVCGGALYDKDTVITAAHCFDIATNTRKIQLFFADLDQKKGYKIEKGQVKRYVKTVIKHPMFGKEGWNSNDIAIIKLKQAVPFNDMIQPICLPSYSVQGGEKAITMGWGNTLDGGNANILNWVEVPVIPTETCKLWMGKIVLDGMLCAGYETGSKDACYGDSGSPLVLRNANGFFELIGIVSWGIGCAETRKPGVYTNVTRYSNWIRRASGELQY